VLKRTGVHMKRGRACGSKPIPRNIGMMSSPLSIPSNADTAPTTTAPIGMRAPQFFHTTSPSNTTTEVVRDRVGGSAGAGADTSSMEVDADAEAASGLPAAVVGRIEVGGRSSCFLRSKVVCDNNM
jgi:hypothetical protein